MGSRIVYLTKGDRRLVTIAPADDVSELDAEDAAAPEAVRVSLAEPGGNVALEDALRDLGV